ncbi:hepatoma-derived growth factor-related protein 2 isoform X2 [Trichogramma pretiosum]|uniref:hepatoma-derived growth factor-related protein 2 isoform X2 n=1 Tax=Trichogramma pretiosum TaxID=7493 RepID=UPI0006C9E530|nr:hepatoma-derived growth factor-related protein 2 isoform X2 [Trichogramma pretiosum]XP_014234893.1 hepatoma-derived growth factor-related protein 2 isoform X2 [Trichogramma pretiosum]XP_014234894.1 hepatoma-derived growth factor-related protein 2 isoform X2 [Trichogramma pretiosum]XP_014234896.1 hepatoma-derived growth factor-related protein 2 isoform X2 [Trichogramma pretiosum]XP_014234897.1 hepatoma-derived growth factor-related protein 2 isoform X2 [Trichogramma pretiosum]
MDGFEASLVEWMEAKHAQNKTVVLSTIQTQVKKLRKKLNVDVNPGPVWQTYFENKYSIMSKILRSDNKKKINTKNSTKKNDSNDQSQAGPSSRQTPTSPRSTSSPPNVPSTSQQSDSDSERTTEHTDEYSNDQSQDGPSGTQTPTSTSNQSSIIQSSDSVCQQTTKDSVDPDSKNQLQTAGSAMKIFEAFMETSCPNQSSIGQPTDPVLQETTKNEGRPLPKSSFSDESSDDEQSSRKSEPENKQAIDQVEEGTSVPETAPEPENKQDIDQVEEGASVPEAAPEHELSEPKNKRSIDQVNEGESIPKAAPEHKIPDEALRPAKSQKVSDNYPGPRTIDTDRAAQEMASSDTVHVSSLPLPPVHYINLYTDENVRRNRAPRPPLPVHDNYTMFGNIFNAEDPIIRPLEAQGIKRLYPQHFDRRRELKKLNHSLLVNFLDLIDILMLCPESSKRAEKVEDLSLLFIHIHHLLNEFRPHQARETLRVMMEMQKRQRVETSIRFQKHLEKVQEIVQNALQSLPDPSESDSKLMVNTEAMEVDNDENTDRRTVDPCSPSDRIMCKEIDDMLLSSGVY